MMAFANKTVFLTGGTGFVGKVLIEKLLRSIQSIEKIYVLIRSRDEVSAAQRLVSELLGSPIFDRLRQELGSSEAADANLHTKISAVAGDVTQSHLGLSSDDEKFLQASVQIVIHSAAIVKLNPPLEVVFQMNCVGALHVLDFAHACPLLQCYMHVSTAYVNTNFCQGKTTVREELYPLHFDVEEAFAAISTASPDELTALHTKLIGSYPNTYTLTKSMAERLIAKRAKEDLPLVICRPTIIGSNLLEPVPGWIDQIAGAGALFLSIGTGMLTICPGSPELVGDIVPVDLVVNPSLVAIAAVVGGDTRISSDSSTPFIVHADTSNVKPFRWEVMTRVIPLYFTKNPSKQSRAAPKIRMIQEPMTFTSEWTKRYTEPLKASLAKAKLSGCKHDKAAAVKLEKLTGQARRLIGVFKPIITKLWVFQTSESRAVLEPIAADSGDDWWLDAARINWDEYVVDFCYGLKKFVLREDAKRQRPAALARL